MKMRRVSAWLPVMFLLAVYGCGGGGGGGSSPPPVITDTIAGSVVKGPVVGATVSVFALNADGTKGTQMGTGTTDASGNFGVVISNNHPGPLLAVASGGGSATYVNEASGASTPMLATDVLNAVLPTGVTSGNVTPLTHIAAARALELARTGTPLATAIASSNTGVAQQYAVEDIVATLAPPANDATRMSTASRSERHYGVVLAGIAQNAATLGVRPMDLAAALATDAKDGLLNGTDISGSPISVPKIAGGTLTMPVTTGTNDIQTAIDTFIASANNKSGMTKTAITLTAVKLGVNTASTLYTTSTVLPAAISGQQYAYTLTATGGTKPYRCALKAGSSFPTGYALDTVDTCKIVGTSVVTTLTISPPFTIILSDSATPAASVEMTLHLTIMPPGPTITPSPAASCVEGKGCTTPAPVVSGGTPAYTFNFDTFANGTPPFGSGIDIRTGAVTIPATVKQGSYTFGVCVVDLNGASNCKAITQIVAAPQQPPSNCDKYYQQCGGSPISVVGFPIPEACTCPSYTKDANTIDRITAGGPYRLCNCN